MKSRTCSCAIAFNFAVESAIRKAPANQEGFKLNGIYQLLIVNLLRKSIYTVKKHTSALLIASKEIVLEVNAELMFKPREQNEGKYHNIRVSNKSSESAGNLKSFEGKNPDKNCIH